MDQPSVLQLSRSQRRRSKGEPHRQLGILSRITQFGRTVLDWVSFGPNPTGRYMLDAAGHFSSWVPSRRLFDANFGRR